MILQCSRKKNIAHSLVDEKYNMLYSFFCQTCFCIFFINNRMIFNILDYFNLI